MRQSNWCGTIRIFLESWFTSCEKSDFDSYDPKVYCIVLLCEIFILKNPIYVSKIEISRFFKSSSSERTNYKHIVVILHVLFF